MTVSERLCLALDVEPADAPRWVERAASAVDWFKIGMRLFYRAGPDIVAQVRRAGARRVFLDLKLHDIPNTVADAARVAADLGVDMLTVHTGGGIAMLRAAADAAPQVQVVGVTVLTSLDETALEAAGLRGPIAELAQARARAARDAGLAGVVCSGHEAADLRRVWPEARLVVPGVRFAGGAAQDQSRVVTPSAAVAAGASLLVVGRMVRAARDPEAALQRLHAELAHG